MEDLDQASGAETQDTTETTDTGSTDESETQSTSDAKSSGTERVYRVGGKDLTSDQLFDTYKELNKGFTQTTQRLSALEKESRRSSSVDDTSRAVNDELNIDPDVAMAIKGLVLPEVQKILEKNERIRESRTSMENSFKSLKDEWDGKDGKPKFNQEDRDWIISEMNLPDNRVFDAKLLWELKNRETIDDWRIKQTLRNRSGFGGMPERTGGTGHTPPKGSSPKTIKEANASAFARTKARKEGFI